MVTVYLVCAVVGSTILVCQLLLMVIGAGGDQDVGGHDVDVGGHDFDVGHDVDVGGHDFDAGHDIGGDHDIGGHDGDAPHHDSSWFFGILSFRAMVAAVAFFGIGGMIGQTGGLSNYGTFLSGLSLGCLAMFVVAWLLRLLHGLHSQGNVHIEMSVGMPGSVYLSVPAHREGRGKVTVRVQSRTMEYQAITKGEALSTGAPVVVVGVIGSNVVEVASALDNGEE